MKLISNIVACAALALSGQVFAQTAEADNSNKGDAAKGQEIATQVCAACHNADGNSLIPANPILAGQHAEYIIKQLNNYKSKDGKPPARESPIMNAMVEPLSPEDMKNLGAYFAQQIPRPGVANDKSLAVQGEQIYRGGNLETNVPACTGCHSPNGAGLPPNYPRLAGQHSVYTEGQLRAFRTDQRTNDENDVMQMITSRMSDKELRAVAEFISGLR